MDAELRGVAWRRDGQTMPSKVGRCVSKMMIANSSHSGEIVSRDNAAFGGAGVTFLAT